MKFLRLHVAGFGRLVDFAIEFGEGVTVVAGPNEAGKSTIVECLLRTLFGFPERQFNEARKRYEPWRNGAPYCATLTYRLDDGRTLEVTRDFGKTDVPTETVEAETRRRVAALSGNKSCSPGESAFGFSLDVYRAAAVVRAGDIVSDDSGTAARALADRLAAVVGSGGDTSAAEAIERLQKTYREIGQSGPSTPLGKAIGEFERADEALRRYRADYAGFAAMLGQRAQLADDVREWVERRARCSAALAAARLRGIRLRINAAVEANAAFAATVEQRSTVTSATPASIARRNDIETAVQALRACEQAEEDAQRRAVARDTDRVEAQRRVDATNAAMVEKRASAAKLEDTIAAHERAAEGRPAISADDLATLEREAEEVDVLESRERTLSTAAAIARQRGRPSSLASIAFIAAAAAVIGAGVLLHSLPLEIAGAIAAVLAAALVAAYSTGSRKRGAAIAAAERAASLAAAVFETAAAQLAARCRGLGCSGVAAVRAARTAQVELEGVRAQLAAATESASLLASKRDAEQARLSDLSATLAEHAEARRRADERRGALVALLDEIAIPPGEMDERLAAFRQLRDAGETAARGDAAVAEARATLDRILRGATLESMEEDAERFAAEAAAGGEPGEFADHTEEDLDRELGLIDARRDEAERSLAGAIARAEEFERLHPVPVAELEERAASTSRQKLDLEFAKAAAKTAWEAIESVKDRVHRDFTPQLNEAVGRSAAAITDGRYADAWVDPADFAIRVRAPETGNTFDASVLSTGTIEQLQFALRAAVAAALGSGEAVPIVYDDALAHADDRRLRAALEHAAGLARDGHQIIFFTQRGDVEVLAAAADASVVRLVGPSG